MTDPAGDSVDPRALARTLEQLPGVAAAAVLLHRHGGPEVWIAALDHPDAGLIRSAVDSVLRQHGLEIPPESLRIGVMGAEVPSAGSEGTARMTAAPAARDGSGNGSRLGDIFPHDVFASPEASASDDLSDAEIWGSGDAGRDTSSRREEDSPPGEDADDANARQRRPLRWPAEAPPPEHRRRPENLSAAGPEPESQPGRGPSEVTEPEPALQQAASSGRAERSQQAGDSEQAERTPPEGVGSQQGRGPQREQGPQPERSARSEQSAPRGQSSPPKPPEPVDAGAGDDGGEGDDEGPSYDDDPLAGRARFFVLRSVDLRVSRDRARCRVELYRAERTFTGEAEDVITEVGRARAACRATLAAIRDAAPGMALALEGLQIVEMFGRRSVAVSIEAATQRRATSLTALVHVTPSVEQAAALACLRAVERWVAW